MITFANSEDPDEMQHNAAFHQGLHFFKGKNDLQTKEYNFLTNLTPLDMYNGLSKVIVSNQKEESISIQRVNSIFQTTLPN